MWITAAGPGFVVVTRCVCPGTWSNCCCCYVTCVTDILCFLVQMQTSYGKITDLVRATQSSLDVNVAPRSSNCWVYLPRDSNMPSKKVSSKIRWQNSCNVAVTCIWNVFN